jgi:hypothetical protein
MVVGGVVSVGTGYYDWLTGDFAIPPGNQPGALQRYEDIVGSLTYVPRTPEGTYLVEGLGALGETMAPLTPLFPEIQAASQLRPVGQAANVARRGAAGATTAARGGERLLWGAWKDYPKVTINGREYAQIGSRMYTRHAVDRMPPSGLGAPAGSVGPSRNVTPNMVEEVIATGTSTHVVVEGVPRTIYTSGNVSVVTENEGNIVVTILRRGSP